MRLSTHSRWFFGAVLGATAAVTFGVQDEIAETPIAPLIGVPQVIGPTATVTELESGVAFTARVDTGAAVTSLHVTPNDLEIVGAASDPRDNLGKAARIRLENCQGDSVWIETRIKDYAEVSSANGVEHRYCVCLPLRHRGVEKEVIVNLKDRSRMQFRMLLGRDFLKDSFVVDVSRGAS